MAKKYACKDLTVIINDELITGFSEDDFLEAEEASDAFDFSKGADGEVTFNQMFDPTGTVTVNVMQTSEAHKKLSALHRSSKETGDGFSLSVTIRSTGGRITASDCRIQKHASPSFGLKAKERSWVILCADLDINEEG